VSSGRRLALTTALCLTVLASVITLPGPSFSASAQRSKPLRAFGDNSYWNAPLPRNAPKHPNSNGILRYMRTAPDAGRGCIRLAGAGRDPWGQPIYWSNRHDREYRVRATDYYLPPELRSLRIPRGARPARTSDAEMTVYDVHRGYVVSLWHAVFNKQRNTWSAGGAQVAYLKSNGLDSRFKASNTRRNRGSMRGNNGATSAVRYDEVRAGAIRHVLRISAGPEVSKRATLPIFQSDGDSSHRNAPAQGTRMRLKSSVNLHSIKNRQARVIARAMQRYGIYIGDSGGTTMVKLENTRAEGRGQRWSVGAKALCRLPLGRKYWEVVPNGYHPHR